MRTARQAFGWAHMAGWLKPLMKRTRISRSGIVRTTLLGAETATKALAFYARTGRWDTSERNRLLAAYRRHLDAAVSPRIRARDWDGGRNRSHPMTAAALMQILEPLVQNANGVVVSVSHDDYGRNYGGVQNVIRDEQKVLGQTRWLYLHVSPASPSPILSDPIPASEFRVSLRLDGNVIGVVTIGDLVWSLESLRQSIFIQPIVHHLMGFAPEHVLDVIRATGNASPIVWAHDFFSACPSYVLMRNDVAFCGAPPLGSAACRICCYGEERPLHAARIRRFFEAADAIVVAPSKTAIERWRQFDLAHKEAAVIPLARLLSIASDENPAAENASRPIRVAHLGAREFRKGWAVFEELALRHAADERYEFFQLGIPDGPALVRNIRNIPVRVDSERRNAMIEAIAEARIDVIIIWSLWPETFCFTAQEALAAGAFIITNPGAGNVWPAIAVNAPEQGCLISDNDQLFAMFRGDDLRARVRSAPRRRGTLLIEGGTAPWLLRRWATKAVTAPTAAIRSHSTEGLPIQDDSVAYG